MNRHTVINATILVFVACVIVVILFPQTTFAIGKFISAPNRADMVYDDSRDILYISNGSSVLRYRMSENSFLTPFTLGGQLRGIDLSPDGNTLIVADISYSDMEIWVHQIDLQTDQITKVLFSRGTDEGGTFAVAFADDGTVLITSKCLISGSVPLRKYSPLTHQVTTLATVREDTMVSASADHSVIGFAENNASGGPFGRYRIADGNILRKDGTYWFNYEISVNRNGSQYAIPTYGGTFIADSQLDIDNVIGGYTDGPVGAVFHPAADIVYLAWANTSKIYAYDSLTHTSLAEYDFENVFDYAANTAFIEGRLKMSPNGKYLFATVQGGIRFVSFSLLSASKGGSGTGTITSTPFGITCGSNCIEPFISSTEVTLTATPDANSVFAGWSGNPDCLDGVVTMDAHKACTAMFSLIPFPSANLRFWLKADEGITRDASDLISTWADLSGNGFGIVQGAGEKQPLFVDSQVNSKPVVRFDGIDDYLESAGGINLINGGDASVIVVLRPGAAQEQWAEILDYSQDTGVNFSLQQADTTTNAFGFADSSNKNTQLLDPGSFQVFSGVFQNGQGAVTYLNGGNAKAGDPYTMTYAEPALLTVGNKSGEVFSGHFKGDIAEVIVYNAAISDSDRQAVEQYLFTKYGIDVVPNVFAFIDQTDVALNTLITSNSITVNGVSAASPISVTGGFYAINSGACNLTKGTVQNGDVVSVCVTSASSFATTRDVTLTVGGSSDTFSVTTGSPIISVAPSAISFSAVMVGGSDSQQQLRVENTGKFSLVINFMALSGLDAALFNVTSGGTNPCPSPPLTLDGGGSCTVILTFSPSSSGQKEAMVTISSNDPHRPNLDVSITAWGSYLLTVAANPEAGGKVTSPGINCGNGSSACTQLIYPMATVQLTAMPATGYHFVRWEGSVTGNENPATVVMNGNKTISALFATELKVCNTCLIKKIQNAVDMAQPGDTIKLATGMYQEHLRVDSSKEISIEGGWNSDFMSKETDPYLTVINGNIRDDGFINGTVLEMLAGPGTTASLDVHNLTITGGWEGGVSLSANGGSAALSLGAVFIARNTGENGGGIFVNSTAGSAILNLENSLIVDNSATNGGGMYLSSTNGKQAVTISNTTISGNYAVTGGGVHCRSRGVEELSATTANSIIWGNFADTGKDIMLDSTSASFLRFDYRASDVGEMEYVGSLSYGYDNSVINKDPIFLNPALWDYRIFEASPVIDAGLNYYVASSLVSDFDGKSRIADGDNDAAAVVDMGADEYSLPASQPVAIKLLSLNGGEKVVAGIPYNIVWESPAGVQSFKVFFTLNEGSTWWEAESAEPLIPGHIVNNQRYFVWNVPMLTKNKKARIKVIGYTGLDGTGKKVGVDISDTPFRIQSVKIVRPNGGEELKANSLVTVRWQTTDKLRYAVKKVELTYTTNGGATWKPMILQSPISGNPGSAIWLAPSAARSKKNCRMKVQLFDSAGISLGQDKSDLFYSLRP